METRHDIGNLAGFGAPQPRPVEILRFRPHVNASRTMAAFFSAAFRSGLIIHSCKLMVGPKGGHWVKFPDQKRRDENDRPVLNESGRPIWDPLVEFRDKATRDRCAELVLDALRRDHPEAFREEQQ